MALFALGGSGEVIARHRQAMGLTVEQVARKVGVSARRFAMYESNRADMPDRRLMAFASAVGVNPAELAMECLFHTDPDLKNKPIGRLFQQTVAEIREMEVAEKKNLKLAGKKPATPKKPATRTPPRRRASR